MEKDTGEIYSYKKSKIKLKQVFRVYIIYIKSIIKLDVRKGI